MLRKLILCLLAGSLGLASQTAGRAADAPGHWPQWRGPNRDGISPETGLLQEWPLDGPPLLWKAEGIGVGYSPVSVAGGRIYSLGFRKPDEYAFALDGNGKELWATRIGPFKESGMNFLSQRQPTVDEDRIYAVTNQGELICLESATGKELWRKSYREDFGAKLSGWGCCDYPLVDGERLICCPGGETATMVALNKKTGELIWKCPIAGMSAAEHSALVVAEVGGVRQYVKLFGKGLVGVSVDGKLLWRYNPVACSTLNVPTPLVRGDHIFATSGYGTAAAMLKLIPKDGGTQVEEAYRSFKNDSWNFGPVRIGDHIYAAPSINRMACMEWGTDKVLWEVKSRRTPAMLYADGHLICRQDGGDIKLVEASAADYREKGSFKIVPKTYSVAWTMPVMAGGRLYLRNQDVLSCYDLRDPKPKVRGPRPPFVPTPQDVVEKMLELAQVQKTDRVYDLGCGDGRIVVTAAKKYGCQAVGIDFDGECARLAWDNVKRNEVEKLVEIVQGDFFRVDWSRADVVTLYLFPATNVRLIPYFEKLKPGARIVSHAADIQGVKPDRVVRFTSKEDGQERSLYVWTTPLRKEPAAADLDEKASGHWPQWRGPERSNVSAETGLLKEWPKAGPALLWKAEGLGQGVASVAVAHGQAFTLGYRGDSEFVTAVDARSGKQAWSARIGPAVKEAAGMRWLSQRTPTVDGDRLYAFTASGILACLETATGKERWRKDYRMDFRGKVGRFGYCDYPLVDGEKLICTPGGSDASVVALNKLTGAVIWKAVIPGDQPASYVVTVAADIHGARQYVACLEKTMAGIAAANGKLTWSSDHLGSDHLGGPGVNRGAPIVRDNLVFFGSSDGSGAGRCGLLKLSPAEGALKVEVVWATDRVLPSVWLNSPVLVGDHVYFLRRDFLTCIEFKTGKVVAEERIMIEGTTLGQSSLTYADGRLYLRSMQGKAALVEVSPAGFRLRGAFDPPRPNTSELSGVYPVVADGRLYLRDMDVLLCYDIKQPKKPD